jgi:hypothetical protein
LITPGFNFIDIFLKLYNTSLLDYIFLEKKTDMKFIILVSNLKEISPSVFSLKKKIYKKNYDAILSKYDSARKKDI